MSNVTLLQNIPRRDIHAFMQWLKGLPEGETAFLRQTFDKEEDRAVKLQAKWEQYKTIKKII